MYVYGVYAYIIICCTILQQFRFIDKTHFSQHSPPITTMYNEIYRIHAQCNVPTHIIHTRAAQRPGLLEC